MNNSVSTVKVSPDLYRVITPRSIVLKSFDFLERLVEDTGIKIVLGH
jgi:hypothetical protein